MIGLRCLGLAVIASLLVSRSDECTSRCSSFVGDSRSSAVTDAHATQLVQVTADTPSPAGRPSAVAKDSLKPSVEKPGADPSPNASVRAAVEKKPQSGRAVSEKSSKSGQKSEQVREQSQRHETGYRGTSPRADREGTTRLAKLLRGSSPANREELKTLQNRIRELTPKIIPVTVAIQVGRANGSGVIVDAAGHVLTAAHVAGEPGRDAIVFLSDGRVAHGVTLGMNQRLDAGLIKITEPGQWPHAPLGHSSELGEGQWCLATGHPGGYNPERPRPPVLRWGRVLKVDESAILTDCTLVGGDSGGPLFDLQGNVIGIHSRIGKNLTINVHVPIDPYRDSWDRLVQSEAWNLMESETAMPWMGVLKTPDSNDATIHEVTPGSPAELAGLIAGDRIVRVNQMQIGTFMELKTEISQLAIGETIEVEIQRGDEVHVFKLTIAAHPGSTE